MTSTLCQSAALARIIAIWLVMITELFVIIVKTILSLAGVASRDMAMLASPASLTLQDARALQTSRCLPVRGPNAGGKVKGFGEAE